MTASTPAPAPPPWLSRPPSGSRSDHDPVTPEVRATVRARAHGRCELGCGGRGATLHHRKLRRHGDHTVPNLVLLCGSCHSKVHHRTAWSYDHGWLLRSHQDPAGERLAYDGEWSLLLADGTRTST